MAGRCGWSGHAVNPSMGARWRHPWRQRSCQPTPPHPRQFPGDGGQEHGLLTIEGKQKGRGLRRVLFVWSCSAFCRAEPCSAPSKRSARPAFALLSFFRGGRPQETVRGRAGWVRGSVRRMDAAAKPPRTGLRRPPQPDPPRHPTDSQLLTLTLIAAGAGLQALPNPLKCLWEPVRTARRSAC